MPIGVREEVSDLPAKARSYPLFRLLRGAGAISFLFLSVLPDSQVVVLFCEPSGVFRHPLRRNDGELAAMEGKDAKEVVVSLQGDPPEGTNEVHLNYLRVCVYICSHSPPSF